MKKIITFTFSFLLLIISTSISAFNFKSSDFAGGDGGNYRDDCDSVAWGSEDCSHDRNSAMRWSSGKMDSGRWGGGPFNTDSRNWGGAPWNWGGSNSPWNSNPQGWNNRNWRESREPWNPGNHGYNTPYPYPYQYPNYNPYPYRHAPYNNHYGTPYNAGPGSAPGIPQNPALDAERK